MSQHRSHLLRGAVANPREWTLLKTPESEGAIFSEFANKDIRGSYTGTFTRYRIDLKPAEIVEYVEAARRLKNSRKL
jgi:hypothetical protein